MSDYSKNRAPARRQHAQLNIDFMSDDGQTVLLATREISNLYKKLCAERSAIDDPDPETNAYICDHHSGIIDRVVGAYLVVVQGEIARMPDLVRDAYDKSRDELGDKEVRETCSRKIQSYSAVETIWQLANFFKHDDELFAAEVRAEPRPYQEHTLAVVGECGAPKATLDCHPGDLERAVSQGFGCSPDVGLEGIYDEVEGWASRLIKKIRTEVLGRGSVA